MNKKIKPEILVDCFISSRVRRGIHNYLDPLINSSSFNIKFITLPSWSTFFYFILYTFGYYFISLKSSANYFLFPGNVAPLLISKDKQVILIIHDLIWLDEPLSGYPFTKKVFILFNRALLRRSVERSNKIVTVSHTVRRAIINKFSNVKNIEKKVRVIFNPIQPPDSLGDNSCAGKEKKINILVSCGLNINKNYKFVCEFLNLRQFNEDEEAFIINTLGDINVLGIPDTSGRDIKDSIFQFNFFHNLDKRKLDDLINFSDVVIVPSLDEGFGRLAIEAFMARKLVLCSDAKIFDEIFGPDRPKFNRYDASTLLPVIIHLVRSEQRIEPIIPLSQFSVEVFTKYWVDVFNE